MKEVKSPRKPFLCACSCSDHSFAQWDSLSEYTGAEDGGSGLWDIYDNDREAGNRSCGGTGYENRIHGQGSEACVRDWSDE